MAYRSTPSDQMSTSGPVYCAPWNISGAAYGADPQNVLRWLDELYSLLSPKSGVRNKAGWGADTE